MAKVIKGICEKVFFVKWTWLRDEIMEEINATFKRWNTKSIY